MPRSRYCWLSEKWNFNFTRISRYRHAQIAILLTVAECGMQFYEGNWISTCLDCDTVDRQKSETSTLRTYFDILWYRWPLQNSECNFMRVICYRHAPIVILLVVSKVKVQFYLDNVVSGCAKWWSVVQICIFADARKYLFSCETDRGLSKSRLPLEAAVSAK